ncbi:MAG: class I SAM-dependent methyltransferase [Longimicrobiales bacterium]|nr:class I SAM-dependent methyltransferase [Longimicrobiales bacterium]
MSPDEAPRSSEESDPFWDRPEIVDRFAARDPDLRLQRLVEEVDDAASFRVLDLGCAGGRNTAWLVDAGVDAQALDRSKEMVARTRERVAKRVGRAAAAARVHAGVMWDLRPFPDDVFDLVVALGVMQSAPSVARWRQTLREIRRVLRPGGRVLVSNFSPESRPEGRPLPEAPGAGHVRLWRQGRPMVLLEAGEHDAAFADEGFRPVVPTESVHVDLEDGYRVTVNALYRLAPDA